jgi:TRAP-type C4-dicarboxylate transport system substrate-binding protein
VAGALLVAGSIYGAAMTTAGAQEVSLSMIGSWAPGTSADADIAIRFMEEVNRRLDGKVEITYRGAAEVVPIFDQPDAVVRGLFDIWYGAPNYWAGIVPASYITELSPFDVPDLGPDSEVFKMMTDFFAKAGVKYLGHYSGDAEDGNHYLISQKKIEKLEDMKGLQIRVPPLTRHFIAAVGAEPVTLPPGEVYVALERGAVSGFTWPYFDSFTSYGWHEVSKFLINEPIYRNGVGIAMNQAKWDSLPDDVKATIMEVVDETQIWALGWVAAHQANQLPTMKAAGMEVVDLPDDEAAKWKAAAEDALWKHFESTIDAGDFKRASDLLRK